MTNMNKVLFTGALVAGLVAGNVAMANDSAKADEGSAVKADKDSCKGKNHCKGKDHPKGKGKNSCKGKNGCKGKKNEEPKTE